MYSTAEVAEMIGVAKSTLLRWIAEGRLRDVRRDWRNWRVWDDEDVARARQVRDAIHGRAVAAEVAATPKRDAIPVYAADLRQLGEGRRHRVELREGGGPETGKAPVLPAIASDLNRLGQGRSHRAK